MKDQRESAPREKSSPIHCPSWILNALVWTALLGYPQDIVHPTASEERKAGTAQNNSNRIYPILLPGLPIGLSQKKSAPFCTTVLTARSGARFDPRYGGSAARAALLSTCRILSDPPFPEGTIHAHGELGGTDAIIWIHHSPEDLHRVLQRLRRAIDGSAAEMESKWALQQLQTNQRAHIDRCSCITDCNCTPHQRIRNRMIEALDPLPAGARRSGCSRREKFLHPKEVDRWRTQFIRFGNVALTLETILDLQQIPLRQHLVGQIRKHLEIKNMAPDEILELQKISPYREPTRTIISPPTHRGDQPSRIVAGWIVDQGTPPDSITALEPRIEIWDEIVSPETSLRQTWIRLQARRRNKRVEFLQKTLPQKPNRGDELALLLLRRNDPRENLVLPRRARRAPIVTVLRPEERP